MDRWPRWGRGRGCALNFLWSVLVVVVALCPTRAFSASRLSSRTITTRYGALKGLLVTPEGSETSDGSTRSIAPVEVYLGVPYASPPTGAMRFMPPGTPQHWKGIRMADRLGPVCPQRPPDVSNETEALRRMPPQRLEQLRRLTSFLVGPEQQSEDCLYLNLYTPVIGS
ncbi:neuroligin-4 [Tropilaelaps mercedesae]|uniref:Neuroligin-4 n=1 Tax=Tropilaelaps mercedesae TaxID=418985 RepID=A0A1V9X6P3_9ACAR|nr:neuroligin-4 [Tropilaelaps mercedesae]